MTRTVTVFGATGKQGSSVVRALIKDGTFTVRGVTRNANSPAAEALKKDGIQVVEANLLIKSDVEKAVAGSEAVFGVTNFWDQGNFDRKKIQELYGESCEDEPEVIQGKNLVESVKKAGVKFFVWSSLPGTSEISKAEHKVNPQIKEFTDIKHYDNKAAIDKLLATSGLNYAILHLGWFLENLWLFGAFTKGDDGTFKIKVPHYKALHTATQEQAFTWVERDLGPCVLALLKNYESKGSQISGKTFIVANKRAPYERLAELLHQSLGQRVTVDTEGQIPKEMADTYEYQATIGVFKHVDIPDPRLVELGVKFSTLQEFANDENVKAKLA